MISAVESSPLMMDRYSSRDMSVSGVHEVKGLAQGSQTKLGDSQRVSQDGDSYYNEQSKASVRIQSKPVYDMENVTENFNTIPIVEM